MGNIWTYLDNIAIVDGRAGVIPALFSVDFIT